MFSLFASLRFVAGLRKARASAPPANTAPSMTATSALDGRTLRVTVTSLSGYPAAAVSINLVADGVNVTGGVSGSGPWEYAFPGEAAATATWTVTATNGVGANAVVAGDVSVAAQQQLPASDTWNGAAATWNGVAALWAA